MTPGARLILADYMQPRAKRIFIDDGGLLPSLRDAHFFDCSAIMPIARQLASQIAEHGSREVLGFLPAPKTWMEWSENGGRTIKGVLLEAEHGADVAHEIYGEWWSTRRETGGGSYRYQPGLKLHQPPSQHPAETKRRQMLAELFSGGPLALALLACINTPRVIGRKTHLPAAKLQRAFASGRPMRGTFPQGAWTEMVLEVTPPRLQEGPCRPGYLSGARALHFVRAHLRVRQGMLELIKAHHRGDPSLGIKRTRYRLVA